MGNMQNKNNLIIGVVVIIIIIILAVTATRNGEEPAPADAQGTDGEVLGEDSTGDDANNGTMMVKVFFGNKNEDPETLNCEKVYPVTREIPATVAVARAAINELLKGPTESEASGGYTTSLAEGVILQSLKIENGVARADFSSKLDEGIGGSCRVTSIRAQIEETLKQFATVNGVVLSVDGNVGEVLQP